MKNYVFGSYAIIVFYTNEKGADIVEKSLNECIEGRAYEWMPVINWGEVFYTIVKVKGQKVARQIIQDLEYYPLNVVDINKDLSFVVARLKLNISSPMQIVSLLPLLNKMKLIFLWVIYNLEK